MCVHLVLMCVHWSDNKTVSQRHEMICMKGHLGFGLMAWIYPIDLNGLSINIFSDDLVQLQLVQQ
jgi:hypothetical protein